MKILVGLVTVFFCSTCFGQTAYCPAPNQFKYSPSLRTMVAGDWALGLQLGKKMAVKTFLSADAHSDTKIAVDCVYKLDGFPIAVPAFPYPFEKTDQYHAEITQGQWKVGGSFGYLCRSSNSQVTACPFEKL